MLSLFSTSSDKAGFRLQYMEVFNWGTFDENVFRINPQGNNSLLTGANASGKSTFIDALLTLMVPATFAASLGFMLPVATAPNTIVFGSKRIKSSGMIKAGFILDLGGIILITIVVMLLGNLVWGM